MPIVSVLNSKGGCGKTTLSVNLSRALKKSGKETLLVDADGVQLSAMRWHERSNGDLLDIIALPKPTLHKDVQKFKNLYPWIIIDGGHHANDMMISAVQCSDVILIPVQPSPFDVFASSVIVDIIKTKMEIGLPIKAAFVVNGAIVGTNIGASIKSELLHYGLPVFKNLTCHRVIYADSAKNGTTVIDLAKGQVNKAYVEVMGIASELELFSESFSKWELFVKENEDGQTDIAV